MPHHIEAILIIGLPFIELAIEGFNKFHIYQLIGINCVKPIHTIILLNKFQIRNPRIVLVQSWSGVGIAEYQANGQRNAVLHVDSFQDVHEFAW